MNGLALDEALERAGVLDDLVAAEHVACSVDEGLTVLTGDLLADVVGVLFEQLLILEHEAHALGDRYFLPSLESVFGVSDGLVVLGLETHGHLADDVLGEGADLINKLGRLTIDPFAVDVVLVDLGCESTLTDSGEHTLIQ